MQNQAMLNQVSGIYVPNQSSSRHSRRRGGMRAVNAIAGALLALGVVATLQAAMALQTEAAVQRPMAFHGKPEAAVRLLAEQSVQPGDFANYHVLPAAPTAAGSVAEATDDAAVVSEAAETLREEAVRVAIEQWIMAWSQHDVAAYLAAYGKEFSPDNGMARGDWEALRRQRLAGRGEIFIALRDLEIELDGAGKANARFRQDYRSGRYQELATPKLLALAMEDGAWRIVAEKAGQ